MNKKYEVAKFTNNGIEIGVNYTTKAHDRLIIIDHNNSMNCELYHLGASLKDVGKKVFAINKMDSSLIKYLLIKII